MAIPFSDVVTCIIKRQNYCKTFFISHVSKVLLPLLITVTEALVLRPLLEDRGCITESIRILVPVDRMKQKCFQITTKQVHRLQQFQLHRSREIIINVLTDR